MLKSKKDEAIKRYLSKVGKLKRHSKMFGSRYYTISYGEGLEILVRFSDHFHGEQRSRADLDLVKTSVGFYVVKTGIGMAYTLGEDAILPYLKSILLLYPEMFKTCDSLMKAASTAEKLLTKESGKSSKLEALIKKKSEEFDLADSIWEENKKLKLEIATLRNTVNVQKTQYASKKAEFESIKKQRNVLASKLDTIKSALSNL